MSSVKKYLGILWMIIGPASILFMLQQAFEKIGSARQKAEAVSDLGKQAIATAELHNTMLQWSIIIIIFIPIAIGMMLFGKYCLQGEYEKLPHSSAELV